ncbi:MAG: aminotransferase class I/II-fold pyridoxal phosphate-dependent enzyme [Cyclobacteriaceae bacterium]|nr:aminotransferase class I/II-fold pyridoxal phosphate-dependent enzyme [Cyclobacteriaceae bacterium]
MDFDKSQRAELWKQLLQVVDHYLDHTEDYRVAPELDRAAIQNFIGKMPLDDGLNAAEAIEHVLKGMQEYIVHTPHPSYYGLFNPRANFPAILADTITACFNPQMAAWSHAPFCSEVENHLVAALAHKFGYPAADGVFATGGAEANQTALLCALNHHFPQYAQSGIQGIDQAPVIYCSSEAHHSLLKAARSSGLGSDALKTIPVDNFLRMDVDALKTAIEEDLAHQKAPLMIVATAGTTGAGSLDSLPEIHNIVDNYGLWLHVDAAYGGAAIISNSHKHHLAGIENSHSLTFDVHKWLSVPMGCSVFITRHTRILSQTFRTTTEYMPKDAVQMAVVDPFTHSIQWSRRFIGLKFYLALLTYGWRGFENMIDRTIGLGEYLRRQVEKRGWTVENHTFLPIVCFRPDHELDLTELCQRIVNSGQAWISQYPVNGRPTLRACITNYTTEEKHIDKLLALLDLYKN